MIDETDQAALDDREGDRDDTGDTGPIQHVKVTSRVRFSYIEVMHLLSNDSVFVGQVAYRGQLPRRGRKGEQLLHGFQRCFG